ncbi:MAG: hypothetical protein J6386_18550 [Candidatus Synoicihabitans palmerolidicus]|nr:hypothetical protein [Candidatus Synoicihabitans palmerolidicus]
MCESGTEMEVLLGAVKKEGIARLADQLTAAGIDPRSITPADVAQARAYERSDAAADGEPVMLVAVGARTTQVLFWDGGWYALRSLALAGTTCGGTGADAEWGGEIKAANLGRAD